MTLRVTGGGGSVTVQGDAVAAAEGVLERLASDGVPGAIMSANAGLWGPDAAEEAAGRLGWVHAPERSRRLLPRLAELSGRFEGAAVVLAGTGAGALAAGVIARTHGGGLTLLDTTDPREVRRALAGDLARTVLVVSGHETVETDAVRRVFEQAFRDAGADPADRIVVVAAPGSALATTASAAGYELLAGDPDVVGGYGALTAYALTPAALAGADVARVLDEADALAPSLRLSYDNPGLVLGAALGTSVTDGRDRLVLTGDAGLAGFGGWVEQLVAESTGKDGTGLLPVVVEDPAAPGFHLGGDVRRLVLGDRVEGDGLSVTGPLGAQFLLWEYAAAVACRVIGVSPFARPAVREAEEAVAALLRGSGGGQAPTVIGCVPALVDGEVEVHGPEELLDGAKDLPDVLSALVHAVPPHGYLAVMAYLEGPGGSAGGSDGSGDRDLVAEMRPPLARRVADTRDAQVTVGRGPRLLHSTGQFHKDGPAVGVFLQITGAVDDDLDVPGRPYSLGILQLAQAFGDVRSLRSRGLPVVRLHLRDRAAGLARIASALNE